MRLSIRECSMFVVRRCVCVLYVRSVLEICTMCRLGVVGVEHRVVCVISMTWVGVLVL